MIASHTGNAETFHTDPTMTMLEERVCMSDCYSLERVAEMSRYVNESTDLPLEVGLLHTARALPWGGTTSPWSLSNGSITVRPSPRSRSFHVRLHPYHSCSARPRQCASRSSCPACPIAHMLQCARAIRVPLE